MTLRIKSLSEIGQTAQQFIREMGEKRIFAFHGSMGAGKTTFIKAVCEELGVRDVINSPTFAIVNEYKSGQGESIYHFDFYRIESPQEALDFGCEEYFYSRAYCFIEWPERIASLLPDDAVDVYILETEDGSRLVEMNV